jgi:catechol 2,3-dioxygenase-like lactoylglutathione lyase family enzyme
MVTQAARLDQAESLDLTGLVWMEHVNLVVGDAALAEDFYIDVLGCSRDAGKSFHVNLGQQQFHLAANGDSAQIVSGSLGLAVPDVATVRTRLAQALSKEVYATTRLALLADDDDCLSLTCPWGNTFHLYGVSDDTKLATAAPLATPMKMVNLHSQGGTYGAHRMAVRGQPGIRFVEIACPPTTAAAVASFYRDVLHCTVQELVADDGRASAVVCVGPGVHLVFVEHPHDMPTTLSTAMEGVHICLYTAEFAQLYQRLTDRGLIWTNPRFVHLDRCDTFEEAYASRTLRFRHVVDVDNDRKLLELEHETRPLRHGQYLKVPKYEPR